MCTRLSELIVWVIASLTLMEGCAHTARKPSNAAAVSHAAPHLVAPVDDPRNGSCIQTDRACLALNPDVSQDTLKQTVCSPGYTKSVRPASSYTHAVKLRLLREAGLDPSRAGEFELDHIVPLVLGGHPRKLSNLALQPWDEATTKDLLEVRLQRQVCGGQMSLFAAQACIAADWRACATKYPQ